MATSSFKLPTIFDSSSSNGVPLFGPSVAAIPSEFTEVPYETFSKADRAHAFPRPADWFQTDYSSGAAAGSSRGGLRTGTRSNLYEAGVDDDGGSFSLVDKAGVSGARSSRGSSLGPNIGGRGGRGGYNSRGGARGGPGGANARGGYNNRGGYNSRGRGGPHILGRGGYGRFGQGRYGDQQQRSRNFTVSIRPDWQILEEIDFSRLAKLRLEVDADAPEELGQYGFLQEYDRTYDRVNTKNPVALQVIDRVHYNPTTSDDPVIQEVSVTALSTIAPSLTPLLAQYAASNRGRVFATDNILSLLMCTTRSVYPWDIVVTREGDKLYFDKRESEESPFGALYCF